MINFLGRIRRSMMTENKMKLYVIYTIGEVVLVVIGIIIAIQINIWNDSRKEVDVKLQLYRNPLDDLNNEVINLEFHLGEFIDHSKLPEQKGTIEFDQLLFDL